MKNRCTPEYKGAKYYYLRGISVCQRWADSFENFLADMGPKPSAAHSIDRINNDLGYSPENCRWATRKEQQNNTRHVKFVTYDGKTMCIRDWAKHIGVNSSTITRRLQKGWELHKVFSVLDSGRSPDAEVNSSAEGEVKVG